MLEIVECKKVFVWDFSLVFWKTMMGGGGLIDWYSMIGEMGLSRLAFFQPVALMASHSFAILYFKKLK